MDSNLTATLSGIDSQLAFSQEALHTLLAEKIKANHSLNQLLSMKEAVNQSTLTVENQSHLPNEAAMLSANATALVNQLMEKRLLTPEPDFDAIENLENNLESVSQKLNMADLEEMQMMLSKQLELLEDELMVLQNQLSTTKQELKELKELSDALPPDCDSNY